MSLYIQMVEGQPFNHPILEENLKQFLEVSEITDEVLTKFGFARFENTTFPPTKLFLSKDGYELCDDGIVRDIITTRDLTQEERLNEWVRRPRDFMLAKSDWTQMPDSPLSAEKKAEWAAYRQQLRDMTETYANIQNPSEIVPPTEPTK